MKADIEAFVHAFFCLQETEFIKSIFSSLKMQPVLCNIWMFHNVLYYGL